MSGRSKEKKLAYMKEYCRRNAERIRTYNKQWYQRNREKALMYMREYGSCNRGRRLARTAKWKRINPLRFRYNHWMGGQRVRFPYLTQFPTFEEWIQLLTSRDTCPSCGCIFVEEWNHSHKCTIDHIVPIQHGGDHSISNLQLLCNSCNARKGTNSPNTIA